MKTMQPSPLDDLLEKLCSGDEIAASQVFQEYEPYLRKVVRRLLPARLRSKFDSLDIVQSAWGDLLQGFRDAGWRFSSANQLRAFLVKATRNRFLDRLRQHDVVIANERSAADNPLDQYASRTEASPSQHAQATDLWQRILHLCPPDYRPILLFKRRGLSPVEIAEKTGLHAGSVRRILRNLASQVAADQLEKRNIRMDSCVAGNG